MRLLRRGNAERPQFSPKLSLFRARAARLAEPRTALIVRTNTRAIAREAVMTVRTILSTKGNDVVTIEPTATLDTAVRLLTARKIGALVVLGADRRVIGILSERDIVRALSERGAQALNEPLAGSMTRNVVTCSEDDTVSGIMGRMTEGKFRHVPVVEQDRLIGIVSIGDVVKHRLTEMERDTEALRDYIQTA
jgi:CBS domain-containing protein